MTSTCVRCGRPCPDAYVCPACSYRAGDQLHTIADMADAARDVATRRAVRDVTAGGAFESRLPLDLTATAKLDAVQNALTTRARDIAATRGMAVPDAGRRDPVAVAALFLAGHVEWMRHAWDGSEPYAQAAFAEIDACARVVAGIARGPADWEYYGKCEAPATAPESTLCPVDCECHTGPYAACSEPGGCGSAGCGRSVVTSEMCGGRLRARAGALSGSCAACGAPFNVAAYRQWQKDTVRAYAFTADEIRDAYGIAPGTIRVWVHRGKLAPHGTDAAGRQLFNLGEVLDVARYDVAQKETERAAKARRKQSQPHA